ncbi:MAG TPA: ATP-binding protein [Bacteroidota bacterium]
MSSEIVERSFGRSIDQLQEVFDFTNDFAVEHTVNDKARYVLDLAVEEFFTNMVKYNPSGRGDIQMRMHLEEDEIIVHLLDPDSEFFDVTKDRQIDLRRSLAERKPGGLGIYLVQKLVENLHYQHHERISTISFRLPLE